MNTNDINKRLKSEYFFLGTYACDRIPYTNVRPIRLIVNTDKSTERGTHWVAMFFKDTMYGEYFDSFGVPPLRREIVNYLNVMCYSWQHNPYKLQGDSSSTCGNYCIFFIQQRLGGLSFSDILTLLTRDTSINDNIIKCYTK